ncbi:unnamed protein product [Urochloa decumbens]|uniref:Uncharacterized protein n=1 Tax=Urochloa decumbens TaxID=240449 RepID=A0ABC9C4T6_9POAL
MHTISPTVTVDGDLTGFPPPSPALAPSALPTFPPPTSGLQQVQRASPRLRARNAPPPLVGEPPRCLSKAPSQPGQTRSLHELSTAGITTGVKAANPQPKSSSLKKKEQQEVTGELEYPTVPYIPPLPPVIVELTQLKGLGYEVLEGSVNRLSGERLYKPCDNLIEGKFPLYGIGFNFLDAKFYDIFATVGSNHVKTYRCLENGSSALLQAYVDEDKAESFYTLSWACDHVDASPLLAVGGSSGIIRVINCATEKLAKSLVGHGGSINDIRTQALNPSLIISASKDESVRLWNVHTGICILIFSGAGGHRNQVLSVDFHPSDKTCFVSCGMDTTVKIWSIKEFWLYVDNSYSWTDLPSKFPTQNVQFPVLVSAIHSDYVDCTRWLGDLILSKSAVENEIVLWEPKTKDKSPGEGSIDILQKYPVPKCGNWFMKFSCDFHFNELAIGNCEGAIYLWEVHSSPPVLTARLYNEQCKSVIRQTAVSYDGSTILGAGDDGNIWRWDQVDHPTSPKKKRVEKRGRRRRQGRN